MSEKEGKRQAKLEYPDRVDMTPEQIAELVLRMPPKKDWRYERGEG